MKREAVEHPEMPPFQLMRQRTERRSTFVECLAFVPPREVSTCHDLFFEELPEDLPVLAAYIKKTYPR